MADHRALVLCGSRRWCHCALVVTRASQTLLSKGNSLYCRPSTKLSAHVGKHRPVCAALEFSACVSPRRIGYRDRRLACGHLKIFERGNCVRAALFWRQLDPFHIAATLPTPVPTPVTTFVPTLVLSANKSTRPLSLRRRGLHRGPSTRHLSPAALIRDSHQASMEATCPSRSVAIKLVRRDPSCPVVTC